MSFVRTEHFWLFCISLFIASLSRYEAWSFYLFPGGQLDGIYMNLVLISNYIGCATGWPRHSFLKTQTLAHDSVERQGVWSTRPKTKSAQYQLTPKPTRPTFWTNSAQNQVDLKQTRPIFLLSFPFFFFFFPFFLFFSFLFFSPNLLLSYGFFLLLLLLSHNLLLLLH